LGDQVDATIGKEFKEYVENRLATLEEGGMRSLTKGISKPPQVKGANKPTGGDYNADAVVVVEPAPKKNRKVEEAEAAEEPKKKKKNKAAVEEEVAQEPKKKKRKAADEEA